MTSKTMTNIIKLTCPIEKIGNNEGHHFFGYYNKSVWDRSNRYALTNKVDVMVKDTQIDDALEIGFYDLKDETNYFNKIGSTTTWNWQMGNQSQWLDGPNGPQVIFNIRGNNPAYPYPEFSSRIVDVERAEFRDLPLPVYVTSQNGAYALTVDYKRLFITHETIGYQAENQYENMEAAPDDDGIYNMDIALGEYSLICSYNRLKEFHYVGSMEKAIHWVSHIEISPNSERVLFLHRWSERVEDETCFLHRLITMNPDGSDMYLLECSDHPLPQLDENFDGNAVNTFDYEKSEYQISHPTWRNDSQIMVWGPHNGKIHYHLYEDKTNNVEIIGADVLTENGHMTYSPDGNWLLSDTYPDDKTNERILFLYHMESGLRYDIGSFYADPDLGKINRCDLHPRWDNSGTKVCIDSVHENERQMYIIDVSKIVNKNQNFMKKQSTA
ncbi:MAG: hypothetical protein QF616_07865 [Candidatus Marinimicrobia bacterium]|jgi:hypothetical protein|nr:hypothetical protein [Candidatus Neomarinimicrobiota bacterium]